MDREFKDEAMLHCFRDAKQCFRDVNQGLTLGIRIRYIITYKFFSNHVKVAEQLTKKFTT